LLKVIADSQQLDTTTNINHDSGEVTPRVIEEPHDDLLGTTNDDATSNTLELHDATAAPAPQQVGKKKNS
jgi:hypothetical protein